MCFTTCFHSTGVSNRLRQPQQTPALLVSKSSLQARTPVYLRRGQPVSVELVHDASSPWKWVSDEYLPAPHVTMVQRTLPTDKYGNPCCGNIEQVEHYTWQAASLPEQAQDFTIIARLKSYGGKEQGKVMFHFESVKRSRTSRAFTVTANHFPSCLKNMGSLWLSYLTTCCNDLKVIECWTSTMAQALTDSSSGASSVVYSTICAG